MRRSKTIPFLAAALLAVSPLLAEKQSPPAGATPKDFRLPPSKTLTLDNGLRVTLVPYGTLPKVTVGLRVRSGNLNEGPQQVWLADLTGDMMKEGTKTMNAEQLAGAFARMGGELNIGTGPDVTTIGSDVLSEFGPDAVKLLAAVVREPALPRSEIERLKADTLRTLSLALAQPQPLADARFAGLVYGNHPYGRLFPSEAMVRGYAVEDVRRFHEENFGAKRTHVYVVGVFDEQPMELAIRDALGSWKTGADPLIAVPQMSSTRNVYLVDRPGAPQSTLRLGLPVVDPSNPDYLALQVTNTLLGGFFSSRVTSNIREDKGYTYSPSSSLSTKYRATHWAQSADVTTAVTGASLKEIFHEIDRLQAEAPSAEELEGVLNYMAGVFVLQNSARGGIVGQLAFVDLHGLSEDYLTTFVRRLHAVTPEDVRATAAKYLRDEEMTIVVVGDGKEVVGQLKPFGKLVR